MRVSAEGSMMEKRLSVTGPRPSIVMSVGKSQMVSFSGTPSPELRNMINYYTRPRDALDECGIHWWYLSIVILVGLVLAGEY